MSIRVLLSAHRQSQWNDSLRALLEKDDNLDVVGLGTDRNTTIELAGQLNPDVIIMDGGPPTRRDMDFTRELLSKVPHSRIVALCLHADRRLAQTMMGAGAAAYLLKDCAFEELVTAVHTVAAQKTYLGSQVSRCPSNSSTHSHQQDR